MGFAVLNAYHAGTYKPGDEILFKSFRPAASRSDLDAFCRRLLADFSVHQHMEGVVREQEKTFAEVYKLFFDWKFGEKAAKKLSKQSQDSARAAYKNCAALHGRVFQDLRHKDLQSCIDGCKLKKASVKLMVSLIKQMYKYAMLYEICDRDYSGGLTISAEAADDEHGVPFSDADLDVFWRHRDDPTIEFLLIMCYSGYRISAYKTMTVNLTDWYFQGGVKTVSGKDRIVPIHTAIQDLVKRRISRDGCLLKESALTFRRSMYGTLDAFRIGNHTPHDCRHTFSRLCEKYGVNENDRKRMMGHSFGADITNGIYGHRTLEDLRAEIEKIPSPPFVSTL